MTPEVWYSNHMTADSHFKDLFSGHAAEYASFRPHYPRALFRYLAELTPSNAHAWDCGTGNGQAALALTEYFAKITATDPSQPQLESASQHPKITYICALAEKPPPQLNNVDLVSVAQALHWFDHKAFDDVLKRVLKPHGIFAAWCYARTSIHPQIDALVRHLYSEILGSYWEKERFLVEDGYQKLTFSFTPLEVPFFEMSADWSFDQLMGYLGTWSSLKKYIHKNHTNPLLEMKGELQKAWGENPIKKITWDLSVRVWKNV